MKPFLIILSFVMLALLGAPGPVWAQPSAVKGFKEWKRAKVVQAQYRLRESQQTLQQTLQQARKTGLQGASRPSLQLTDQVRSNEMELELAQDLTVSDYFVGYLTKLPQKNAYREAAKRLSDEEVADLMTAYASSVFGAQKQQFPASASNFDAGSSR